MKKIMVDFEKKSGKIKPLHGINNAPLYFGWTKLFHYLRDAGIPFARMHDTNTPATHKYVDIANIFHDFNADPEDPDSYDFAFTDHLFKQVTAEGTEVFYRLGASIEGGHRIKAYKIFPPADNLKWAKICEGIIKHYNYGWANGFHYNIRYWEIWNEPDNAEDIADNPMWKGTKEQFFELYEVAANYLKNKFPELKIGGYGSCGFYALCPEGGGKAEGANARRNEHFIEFMHEFFRYITSPEHKAPLDFFSWHSYDQYDKNIKYAKYVEEQLNAYGLTETESILDEWNPGINRRGTELDASAIAQMMCALHGTTISLMTYYDGQVMNPFCGLFNSMTVEILPAYYALHSYNELYVLGNEVYHDSDEDFPILAATDGKIGKILIPNTSGEDIKLAIELFNGWEVTAFRVLDGINGLVNVELKDQLIVPTDKLVLVECTQKSL